MSETPAARSGAPARGGSADPGASWRREVRTFIWVVTHLSTDRLKRMLPHSLI